MRAPTKHPQRQLHRRRAHQVVRGRHAERLGQLPRPASAGARPTRSRSSGRATTRTASRRVTYRELHEQVCRLANVLKGLGVKRGDRVTIYLPMVVEAAVAMLACARIGAIHAVVFGGFSPDSLANRIQDCGSTVLITADEGRRGGRKVALKTNADEALKQCPTHPARAGGDRHRRRTCRCRTAATTATRRCWPPPQPDCAPEEMARRGPAVHPLHLRQHRQAEGRAAHHRRLHGLGALHARAGVRLPAGRGLLVHRRCRLGDRAHLYRLRPARQRRDHADVRGRPDLPRQLAASGRWSTSTRSTSSTPRPPPSAR